MATPKVLLQAMKTVFCVYTDDFRNIDETHELQGGELMGKSANLLLCDALYNIRRQWDREYSNHEVFNAKDMDAFGDFAEYFLKSVGYRRMFCYAVQFVFWWRCFRIRKEEIEDIVGDIEAFSWEQKPLFHSREHSNYLQDPQLKRLWHIKVLEEAISFWRKGLPFNYMFARVFYDALGDLK